MEEQLDGFPQFEAELARDQSGKQIYHIEGQEQQCVQQIQRFQSCQGKKLKAGSYRKNSTESEDSQTGKDMIEGGKDPDLQE